jgi:hypothetical protein
MALKVSMALSTVKARTLKASRACNTVRALTLKARPNSDNNRGDSSLKANSAKAPRASRVSGMASRARTAKVSTVNSRAPAANTAACIGNSINPDTKGNPDIKGNRDTKDSKGLRDDRGLRDSKGPLISPKANRISLTRNKIRLRTPRSKSDVAKA